jgi:hypothetical protein
VQQLPESVQPTSGGTNLIIRARDHKRHYVVLDKSALDDERLSFRAKGLHAWLIAQPDDWNPCREHLASISTEGRAAVASALRELEAAGYFERRKLRNPDGTFRYVVNVYEVSTSTTYQRTVDGLPATGEPATVHSPLTSNKEQVTTTNKPRATSSPRYPAEWYERNVADYQRIKGITLRGPETDPVRRELRTIYKAGHTPADVEALMTAFAESGEVWAQNWTIRSVRARMPEWKAGKLLGRAGFSKSPENASRLPVQCNRPVSVYLPVVEGPDERLP